MSRRPKPPRSPARVIRWAAVLALLALPGSAAAQGDDKRACMAAFDRSQQLRAAGKLRDARDALIECTRDACPTLIKRDCTQWLSEVMTSLPSVVIGAQDADGKDLVNVRVKVDGTVVSEKLEGKSFTVDPGPHLFRYELVDGTALEEQVLIREGEKNRPLSAKFGRATPQKVAPTPPVVALPPPLPVAPAPAEGEPKKSSVANYILGITAGALGLGALGGALALDLQGTSDANNLKTTCAPRCSATLVDPISQKYTDAQVLLAVGGGAIILGTVVLIVQPFRTSASPSTAATEVRVETGLAGGRPGVRLGVTF